MSEHISPIAVQVAGARNPADRRIRQPWGLLLHTSGSGVTDKARKTNRTPLEVALEVYIAYQNGAAGYTWGGPGYVIDHDGTIHQIAPDDAKTEHAGSNNRPKYFDGSWETKNRAATHFWKQKWAPRYAHPYMLFPTTSPNIVYIGAEMIPCGDGFGVPMRPGLRFTKAQHNAAIRLAVDCGTRHGWPAGWMGTSRLLGHEDVDPLERSDTGGGWDVGALRERPYFDFLYVRNAVETP